MIHGPAKYCICGGRCDIGVLHNGQVAARSPGEVQGCPNHHYRHLIRDDCHQRLVSHIQGILVQNRGLSNDIWQQDNGQNDDENMLLAALDTSLTGCLVLFSCLDQEIATVNKSHSVKNGGQLSWFGRVRFLINNDRLQELLTALRGQQTAINLLIQLMQTEAISEIKRLLSENQPTLEANLRRTQTMRESLDSSSSKSVSASVLERTKSIIDRGKTANGTDAYSHVAPSDLEFDFDDAIVNSRTYRRAMAAAEAAAAKGETETIQEEPRDGPSQSSSVYSMLSPPATPHEAQIAVPALAVADNIKPKQPDYRKVMDDLENDLTEWASRIPPNEPTLSASRTTSKAGRPPQRFNSILNPTWALFLSLYTTSRPDHQMRYL
ncbi:hypothetical protein QBC37DRAFT_116293 [Rhypophila decipiens]|uniref:Uncharacterized protein n=1 Tax=Rhypophila decipiens TaxID=261697 RepID=A0AAN6XUA6_9PEZI|nr:hypothetical protein QBC37DRAFT_116293 [Rhypophila decipiens]